MRIDEFWNRFGGKIRNVEDVKRQWQLDELESLLQTVQSQHDQIIGSAVIVGDAVYGDGMLDQIPRELKDAFVALMRERPDVKVTNAFVRQELLEHMRTSSGEYLSWDDSHLVGYISYAKGQIGENVFRYNAGGHAFLAPLNQPGWDVGIPRPDHVQLVQVKLYSSAREIVDEMRNVHEKIVHGLIRGVAPDGNIDFAVPADLVDKVNALKLEHFPDLHSMHVLPIPIDAHTAAGIVREGMSNVGPEQLSHFFDELLCGAVAAGSLHAIVNGFLWYKGSKEFSEAFASAVAGTAISTAGIGIGLLAETLCHTVMLSSAVGIGGRLFLGRLARSRWNFAEFLENSIAESEARTAALRQLFGPVPTTA